MPSMILDILLIKLTTVFLGFALIMAPVACGDICGIIDDPCSQIEQTLDVEQLGDIEVEEVEQLTSHCIGCGIQIMSQENLAPALSVATFIPRSTVELSFIGLSPESHLRPPRV